MAKRQRWLISGPWKHPDSGILYYRKATPKDLSDRKDALAALGITIIREVQRSLRTKDAGLAKRKYAEVMAEQEAVWDQWRAVLLAGPVDLSHMNRVALAGRDALALATKNRHEPLGVAWPRRMVAATCDNLRASLGSGDPRAATAIADLGQELQALSALELPSGIAELLSVEPEGPPRELAEALGLTLLRYREAVGWLRAPTVAGEVGIAFTKDGRKRLASEISRQ